MIFTFRTDELTRDYAMKSAALPPVVCLRMFPVTHPERSTCLSLIILSHIRIWCKLSFHCVSCCYATAYVNATNVFTKSFVNLYVCVVGVEHSNREGVTAVTKRSVCLEVFIEMSSFKMENRCDLNTQQ